MESIPDLICRLCLTNEGDMEAIFNNENDLAAKIMDVTSIEVTNLNGLPNFVCEFCKSKLIIAFHFKKQCIKSNKTLMEQYLIVASSLEDKKENIKKESLFEESKNIERFEMQITNSKEKENKKIVKNKEIQNIPRRGRSCKRKDIVEKSLELINMDDEETIKELIHDKNTSIVEKDTNLQSYKLFNGKKVTYHTMCQVCGKMQQNLKQHMLTHTGEKLHKCPHCNKGFSQRGNLNHHINIHTGNKPYKCNLCDKAFCDPNSLKSHMVSHTGERKYRCEICGNAFGYSHTLSAHIRTHVQDRKHACSYCKKLFLTRHGLKKHTRIHTGEKPYKCEYCIKSFTSSGNLSTHRRIHTKERPYECTVCKMDFAYRNVLASHMRVHAIVPQKSIVNSSNHKILTSEIV